MKFGKKYEAYMRGMEAELPSVGIKRLKRMLKTCRRSDDGLLSSPWACSRHDDDTASSAGSRRRRCTVCDGSFFPSLLDDMSAVVGCFNEEAKKLHLASGLRKYTRLWFTSKGKGGSRSHGRLIRQGRGLVTYAIVNAVAMRKILKKYDKIHGSKQGQEFKAQAQSLHIEILQSPWLCELMAFHMNFLRSNNNGATELFGDCSLVFDDDRPTLSCNLFDFMRVDITLTCSICLDTVFDPVSLSCGHIFCYLCCCSAASVTPVDGLKSAGHKSKCPLCRQQGVFPDAMHLDGLNMLLSHSCPEYWEKRMRLERAERVRLAKQHWESQCRAFLGI